MASNTMNTSQRNDARQADSKFAGDRVKVMPLGAEVANVRNGGNPAILQRVPWMLAQNAHKKSIEYAHYRKNSLDRNDPKHRQKLRDNLSASVGDNRKAAEIAAYRQFEITNNVLSLPFALGAFQEINLSADELPLIVRPKPQQFFTCRYVGQDGGARFDQWRTTQSAQQQLMRTLSTDRIEYPIVDIQLGSLEEYDRVNASLTYDMEMKIDADAQANLDAAVVESGLRALLNIHPLVIQANIPDSNMLDLSGQGVEGVLDISKIKQILDYISRFGVGIDADGPFSVQSMHISPLNLRDHWDFVDLVSTFDGAGTPTDAQLTVPTGIREQIFNTGMITNAWGMQWATKPNARIAKGTMYVFSNQPVGWFFTKTDLDKLIRWDGPDHVEANRAEVLWNRVLQFVIPDLWQHRFLKITF